MDWRTPVRIDNELELVQKRGGPACDHRNAETMSSGWSRVKRPGLRYGLRVSSLWGRSGYGLGGHVHACRDAGAQW